MSTINDNFTKSPELKASIIEPILLGCLNNSSFNFLLLTIQKIFRISCFELKNYLLYMIEYGVISYNGQRQEFKIERGGIDLLNIIKKEKTIEKSDINDIIITFEHI